MSPLSSSRTRPQSWLAIAFECPALDPVIISLEPEEVADVISDVPAGNDSDPRGDAPGADA